MAEDRYWEAVGTYRCIDGRCQQRKFRHRDRSDRIAARGTADRIGHTAYITEHMAEDRYWEAVGTYRCIDGRCQQRKLDRKSTRLNSSHSSISYAVFCLKKKKKK